MSDIWEEIGPAVRGALAVRWFIMSWHLGSTQTIVIEVAWGLGKVLRIKENVAPF